MTACMLSVMPPCKLSDRKQSVFRMVKFKFTYFAVCSARHSSVAAESLLRFKDAADAAFDIQHKFQGSSHVPLNPSDFFSFTAGISEVDPGSIFTPTPPTSRPISVSSLKRTSSPL